VVEEAHIQNSWWECQEERDHWEDLDAGGG
jgi:hypothetical protein